jgi:SAM-dependent methyltransferase
MVEVTTVFPDWRGRRLHECSPTGPASEKLRAEGRNYTGSYFVPPAQRGTFGDSFHVEDLEALTFEDESIDIFITQDVLEHLLRPDLALREIARVLRPGGAHIFTVPIFPRSTTLVRAERLANGSIRHRLPPEFHQDPMDPNGSLVVREWGNDICDYIEGSSGLRTNRHEFHDANFGLEGQFMEVCVTRK